MTKIPPVLYLAPAAALILSCGASHAQIEYPNLPDRKGVEAKPLIVHAAMNTEVMFDTNVFLTDKDEKFDIITLVNPVVGLELPLRDHRISVEYDVGCFFFGQYEKQNYQDQKVTALAEINLTDYKITVRDQYKNFKSRSGSEDTNRVHQQTNYLRAGVKAEFDQLGFDAGYTFGMEDYLSKQAIYQDITYQDKDRLVNVFDGEVSYRFLPKTYALGEIDLGFINYSTDKSPNSWFIETLGGVRGELTHKLTANIRGGLRYQGYESSDYFADKSYVGLVARGGLTYALTEDDIFDLKIERNVYESTFDNMNYYNVNYIGLDYRHNFNKKISGNILTAYQLNLYPGDTTVDGVTAKRYDNFFISGVGLRYDMRKWLSLEARYDISLRKSRFSTYDYLDNLITLRGTVGF